MNEQPSIFLKIAGFFIGLKFNKSEPPFLIEKKFAERTVFYYQAFITKEKPHKVDYWIDFKYTTQYKMLFEDSSEKFYINFYEKKSNKKIITYYHVSGNQLKIIIRSILQELLQKNNGMIIHASAAKINDKAAIFFGKSGAGKSTISTLLSDFFPKLADDNIILKKEGKKYFLYQAPFIEKDLSVKKSSENLEVGWIFFLKKASYNKIKKISKEKVIKKTLEQLFTDSTNFAVQSKTIFEFINDLNDFYLVEFSLDDPEELGRILKQAVL